MMNIKDIGDFMNYIEFISGDLMEDISQPDKEELDFSTLPICPKCGGMGIFDDHVDTDLGLDTADIYQCEECNQWFYVGRL